MNNFRCNYCGQFIGYDELDADNPKAEHNFLEPDSELSVELFETYHIKCKEKENGS